LKIHDIVLGTSEWEVQKGIAPIRFPHDDTQHIISGDVVYRHAMLN
jgi:hypothetical protein